MAAVPPPPPTLTDGAIAVAALAAAAWAVRRLWTLLTADSDVATAHTPPAGPTALSGTVVWITGASSGIGAATAAAVVAAGGRVVLTARRAALLEAAVERLGG
ncbi:hypothetical protein BU14_0052s0046, partial [Porphyra umbilicalis]